MRHNFFVQANSWWNINIKSKKNLTAFFFQHLFKYNCRDITLGMGYINVFQSGFRQIFTRFPEKAIMNISLNVPNVPRPEKGWKRPGFILINKQTVRKKWLKTYGIKSDPKSHKDMLLHLFFWQALKLIIDTIRELTQVKIMYRYLML